MRSIGIFSIFLLTLLACILMSAGGRSSAGAPGGHSGAPGENDCSHSGCHDDGKVNSGTAVLELLGIAQETFNKGNVYDLKIKISDPNVTRFGFQLLALETDSLKNAGEFQLTDEERTQMVIDRQKNNDRKYLTYTFNGTDAVRRGLGEWTVKWKAPSSGKKISFYLAAVSANDDMQDKGDHVYTLTKTVELK